MTSFNAVRLHRTGNPVDVLQIDPLESRHLAPDEVCIRVQAFALNRADWLFCRGEHYTLPKLPSRLGSECAGIVERVGGLVKSVRPGDRVCTVPFDTSGYGVQGELAIVPSAYVAPWPEGLTAIEATSVWMQYLTAYFALVEVGNVVSTDYVLVPAATSSAGLGAIQLAKKCGANVIATTRSPRKIAPIEAVGADHVIVVGDDTDLTKEILALTGGLGVRLVYDPVAGSFMRRYLGALAWQARIFIYGLLSGEPTELDIVPLVRRAAVVHPFSMFNHVRDPMQLQLGISFVLNAIRTGGLRPTIGQVFPFSRVIDAYRELDAASHFGKIVVELPQ
jgi:NADPH2:quinone reductase